MMPSVSGQRCSPELSICVAPPSPARRMIAAAPSPNRLMATMLALVSSSRRSASEQSSTATSSTLVPGRACARRAAIDRPETPPAQPRPNTGTRAMSERNPIRPATRASRLGVAMPVEQTVTTVSISAAGQIRTRQRLPGGIDEQRLGAFEKGLGPFRPAARCEIPVERLHAMALDDPGIGRKCLRAFRIGEAAVRTRPTLRPEHPSAEIRGEERMSPARPRPPATPEQLWALRVSRFPPWQ